MSKIVEYSVNGIYWSYYNMYVSQSNKLYGELKPKERLKHDWLEYHGTQYDLDSEPIYEERKFSLDVFVTGDNWDDLIANYDAVMKEFRNNGLQRLIVEWGSNNPLVYDVFLVDEAPIKKQFKDGKMYGTTTLNFVEPSPIKRVFKLVGSSLDLSYNSTMVSGVNIDGTHEFYDANVSISGKTLSDRTITNSNTPTTSNEHYIVISGRLDKITNLTTNATEI